MPAPRKQARDELEAHLAQGDLVKGARALLKEHVRQHQGKPVTPEAELDYDAVGNLRDALDYLEAGNYELAMHHAWRAQVRIAQRGRVAGIECVDEQGVWQCIEMCRGAAETRDAAVREKDAAVAERDQAHGLRLHAEGRRAAAEAARDRLALERDQALQLAHEARVEAASARALLRAAGGTP